MVNPSPQHPQNNESPIVEAWNLTKVYMDASEESFTAVDSLSFSASRGEIFGLLGPNGAGKTTVLRMLATILQPTSGTIRVDQADSIQSPEQVRRKLGFVSNNTALYDRMTPREIVLYFGRLHDIPDPVLQDRLVSIFDQLRMNDFAETPCGKLSTGMKQKVSIARALIHEPPVIVFDEASVGLDVLVARSLMEIIAELKQQGKCVIFSTHIMREVERLCDRVAIMHRGRLLDTGTLPELAERHSISDFEDLFFWLMDNSERELTMARPGDSK